MWGFSTLEQQMYSMQLASFHTTKKDEILKYHYSHKNVSVFIVQPCLQLGTDEYYHTT